MLTDLEMWSALVGALLPPVVALVNRSTWPKAWRLAMAVVCCLVAAGITCWVRGELNHDSYAHSVLLVLTATLATYHWAWRPSTIAPAIEAATS